MRGWAYPTGLVSFRLDLVHPRCVRRVELCLHLQFRHAMPDRNYFNLTLYDRSPCGPGFPIRHRERVGARYPPPCRRGRLAPTPKALCPLWGYRVLPAFARTTPDQDETREAKAQEKRAASCVRRHMRRAKAGVAEAFHEQIKLFAYAAVAPGGVVNDHDQTIS